MSVSEHNCNIHMGAYTGTYLTPTTATALELLLAKKDELYDLLINNGVEILDLTDEECETVISTKTAHPYDGSARGTLRKHQPFGAFYLYSAKRAILGDSVGMGKTVQTACLINIISQECIRKQRDFKFIFISGSTYTEQNRRVIVKRTGLYCELLTDGSDAEVRRWIDAGCPSVAAPHSVLHSPVFCSILIQQYLTQGYSSFNLLVIDECSIFANKGTIAHTNTSKLSPMFEYVIGLNAKLYSTSIEDVYNQIDVIDPTLLPNITAFRRLFTSSYSNGGKRIVKLKNSDLCRDAMRYRFLCRTRKSEGAVFEGNVSEIIYVLPSEVQKQLIKKTSRWSDVYTSPALIDPTIEYTPENVPKLQAILDILGGCDDIAIIYTRAKAPHYVIQNALTEIGITSEIINGDTKKSERDAILLRVNSGETRVLLTNVKKGLDLKNATLCIIYGMLLTPEEVVQVEGRILRDFNVQGKTVYLLLTKGTKESRYLDTLATRLRDSDKFNSDYSLLQDLIFAEATRRDNLRKDNKRLDV